MTTVCPFCGSDYVKDDSLPCSLVRYKCGTVTWANDSIRRREDQTLDCSTNEVDRLEARIRKLEYYVAKLEQAGDDAEYCMGAVAFLEWREARKEKP